MANFSDSLRGYSADIFRRDGYCCRYCGVDGTSSFATWLTLTQDHLLPRGHARREELDFIVTACAFCNTADNRYFDQAATRGLKFDGLTPAQLIAQRLPFVQRTRESYFEYWEMRVKRKP